MNSTLTVRQNVFHAFLYSIFSTYTSHLCSSSDGMARALEASIHRASGIAIKQQRHAVRAPPIGHAASTLLASCEVEWLGWVAVSVLCEHKHYLRRSSLPALSQRLRRRAERQCLQVAEECLPMLHQACTSVSLLHTSWIPR